MKARAVHFVGPRAVELREVDVPDPAPDQALVRTTYSGISSGTEMLAYRGKVDPGLPLDETLGALGGTFSYPFRYGYSCVGTVERSTGELASGSRVFCFHPHQDRIVVSAVDAVVLEDADPRQATLLPLVEAALQLSLDAGRRYGEFVVVAGLGAVGILASILLQRSGVVVVGSEPAGWRRDVAGSVGIDAVSPSAVPDAVDTATGGRGADLVVDVTGNPDGLGASLDLLAHEGLLLVGSWYGTQAVSLPLGGAFHRRRLSIRSSQVSTIPAALSARWDRRRRLEAARRLLAELPLEVLATHEFPFERATEAFAAIDERPTGLMHAALRYGD